MSNLIDRDSILADYKKIYSPAQYIEFEKYILSIPLQQQWIPVSERLPEVGGEYIISEDIGDGFNEVYTCGFDELHGFCYDIVSGKTFYPKVTHWQPLPLSPNK